MTDRRVITNAEGGYCYSATNFFGVFGGLVLVNMGFLGVMVLLPKVFLFKLVTRPVVTGFIYIVGCFLVMLMARFSGGPLTSTAAFVGRLCYIRLTWLLEVTAEG